MNLVIVDTPAEAKLVAETLGENWQVEPCMGGVRGLPVDRLGVDVLHDFQPTYTLLPRKGNLVRRLMRAISKADAIYIATPPSRSGEVMGWHVLALSPALNHKPIYRTPLIALTSAAIKASFAAPDTLNLNWVEAEITRRIVDRLINYLITPLATKALNTKVSVTRASLVCLLLLAERERAIKSYTPEVSWTAIAHITAEGNEVETSLHNPQGKVFKLKTREQADSLVGVLSNAMIWVDKTANRTIERAAPLPFTMTALLADAEAQLGIAPHRTLALAETLYEAGWIADPKSDLIPSSTDALEAAQVHILSEYGLDYLIPAEKLPGAPEELAYIYPTDVSHLPEKLPGDGAALYGLIWRRFVASCMASARYEQVGVRILTGSTREKAFPLEYRVRGERCTFDGWLRAGSTDAEAANAADLPTLAEGTLLTLSKLRIEEQIAEPSLAFTRSELLATLTANGVNRTAEYATAVQGLIEGHSAQIQDGRLVLTQQGSALASFIESHFDTHFSATAAAQLESELVQIAAGQTHRVSVLRDFWSRFSPALTKAAQGILDEDAYRPVPTQDNHHPVILRPLAEG